MIQFRPVAALGILSGLLAALAVVAVMFLADSMSRLEAFYNSPEYSPREQNRFVELQLAVEAAGTVFPWVVLAALIPAVAALALLTFAVQAGSASASASRDTARS